MFKKDKLDYYKKVMLANDIISMEFKKGETLEITKNGDEVNYFFNPSIDTPNPEVIESNKFTEFKRLINKLK